MRKHTLYWTNIVICIIILLGFIVTSIISYQSNQSAFEQDAERVSELTSQGIYHQIDKIFMKPINVATTIANDHLLRQFLKDENNKDKDSVFLKEMHNYLRTYQDKYNYDSVSFISARTNQYYHFKGLDRNLAATDSENNWYYKFIKSNKEYFFNIDNDQSSHNKVTVFVNCKMKDQSGRAIGVVSIGFKVEILQSLLKKYNQRFDVHAFLIDKTGKIEISTNQSAYEAVNLFNNSHYSGIKGILELDAEQKQAFWHNSQVKKSFIVAQYIPALEWKLVIDNDMSTVYERLNRQLINGALVLIIVIIGVLIIITKIMRKYNAKVIQLTIAREQQHRKMFREATEQLYENIYEVDVTHNCAANPESRKYFESLGASGEISYDEVLHMIMGNRVKEEFRQGYLDMFSTSNILKAFQSGKDTLRYDFLVSSEGNSYYWMRITARIFLWDEDKSVRMFVYRQNIDLEKRRESQMQEQIQRDPLTGIYNKVATENNIEEQLEKNPEQLYAFMILDIDDFKRVNDTCGHAAGDLVIIDFAEILKKQFRKTDIVGRIGGDEFVVFLAIPSLEWAKRKVRELVAVLDHDYINDISDCRITASIGICIAPNSGTDFDTLYKNADHALYQTKRRRKNGFTFYKK